MIRARLWDAYTEVRLYFKTDPFTVHVYTEVEGMQFGYFLRRSQALELTALAGKPYSAD